MKKIQKLLLAGLVLAGFMSATLVTANAASATTITPHVSITKTVHPTYVTLSGYVTPKAANHLVYLQWRRPGGNWRALFHQRLSATSHYSWGVEMHVRGTYYYRALFPANDAMMASRVVQVNAYTSKLALFRHYSGQSRWQGPTVQIPTRDYKLIYSYQCQDDSAWWDVSWNPASERWYEYLSTRPAAGKRGRSGTWYGHQGGQSGYFEVDTQPGCTWSFKIYYRVWV
jgi:hypothetical protein